MVAGDRPVVVDHSVLEGLDHGADAGQRRAQVVRHPGDQLPPAAVERGGLVLSFGQPGRRQFEFGAERDQFRRRDPARAVSARPAETSARSLVSQPPSHRAERSSRLGHPLSEHQCDEQRDRAGCDQDHEQGVEVVA